MCRGRTSNSSIAFEIVGVLYRRSASSCVDAQVRFDIEGLSVQWIRDESWSRHVVADPGSRCQPNRTEVVEPGSATVAGAG